MHLTLISPLRIPFSLPKYRLLANHTQWRQIIVEATNKLDQLTMEFPELSAVDIGNYGWGQTKGNVYQVDHPGWFFADHFLLRFASQSVAADLDLQNQRDQLPADTVIGVSDWHCDVINNTLAKLVVNLNVGDCVAFTDWFERDSSEFQTFQSSIVQRFLQEESSFYRVLLQVLNWLEKNLLQPMQLADPDFCRDAMYFYPADLLTHRSSPANRDLYLSASENRSLFVKEHPIYRKHFHHLWTHTVYCFSAEDKECLIASRYQGLSHLIGREQTEALKLGQDGYGWGCTSILIGRGQFQSVSQWSDANGTMQYFYSCFDIADTVLPLQIAYLQKLSNQEKHKLVLNQSRQIRTDLSIIMNDYNDLRSRTASKAYTALEAYHQSWRMDRLMQSISSKLSILDGLIENASDEINSKTEATMQAILFFITLLGLVSLTTSIHAYLSGGYEVRLNDPLPQMALSIGKGEVVVFSMIGVTALLIVYYAIYKQRSR